MSLRKILAEACIWGTLAISGVNIYHTMFHMPKSDDLKEKNDYLAKTIIYSVMALGGIGLHKTLEPKKGKENNSDDPMNDLINGRSRLADFADDPFDHNERDSPLGQIRYVHPSYLEPIDEVTRKAQNKK